MSRKIENVIIVLNAIIIQTYIIIIISNDIILKKEVLLVISVN